MGASHFFVGLGAGIALLTVPVLTLGPGTDLPHRFASWIDGPPPQAAQLAGAAAVNRPTRGYKRGDPTPVAEAPPTIEPALRPTAVPQVQPALAEAPPSAGSMRTGVIRAGGGPVYVRRAAGVESADDPQIADGAPVLVSAGGNLQIGGQPWRAVRGLSGIVGWVPSAQVIVDGEGPPLMVAAASAATPGTLASNATPSPTATANLGSAGAAGDRLRVANTDGVGVVLRNSPRDGDKSPRGLMDGANVSVLERSGNDWVHVRADNGQEGWIPTRYVVPGS